MYKNCKKERKKLLQRFVYWIQGIHGNKHKCRSCCLNCEWWEECKGV